MNRNDTFEKLLSYAESPKVLIGHQYSTLLSILHGSMESDIHALTGGEAAVVGLDFLSLIGAEGADPLDPMEDNLKASRKAIEAGSLMTLSCHFPNFANSIHIKKKENGWDFSRCTYFDAKIQKPCAEELLKHGEVQEKFHAALDLIAEYCMALQKMNQMVIFRPFHEDNGDWFWWGTLTAAEDFKRIWIHIHDYMERKGLKNLLYAYSPNGPILSLEQYLERYPGDKYVDVLGLDYYDDVNSMVHYNFRPFGEKLKKSCEVIKQLSMVNHKIPVISETGVRIKAAGADSLLPSGNPIKGAGWYEKVLDIASETGMSYLLLWGNYGRDNFFVPYKGHELEKEFLHMAYDPRAVLSKEADFAGGKE